MLKIGPLHFFFCIWYNVMSEWQTLQSSGDTSRYQLPLLFFLNLIMSGQRSNPPWPSGYHRGFRTGCPEFDGHG